MKCRSRPSAFSRSGGNSSSRLNSVTNSSVRSRPRLSIARRRPWAWPRLVAGMGRMARTLVRRARAYQRARPGEPGRARPNHQSSRLSAGAFAASGALFASVFGVTSPVGTTPWAGVAAAALAVCGGSVFVAGAFAVGFRAGAWEASGFDGVTSGAAGFGSGCDGYAPARATSRPVTRAGFDAVGFGAAGLPAADAFGFVTDGFGAAAFAAAFGFGLSAAAFGAAGFGAAGFFAAVFGAGAAALGVAAAFGATGFGAAGFFGAAFGF